MILPEAIELARRSAPRGSMLSRVVEPVALIGWLQRGGVLPTLRYVRRHGRTVSAGPFRGLRYPHSALLHVRALAAKLGGTYELELHDAIESLIDAAPQTIVNIGAAEGSYAIGVARRLPAARVVAFEADPYHARSFRQLAAANPGAAERVELRGVCTVAELAALEPADAVAVICDCEGDEDELIDPARVEWLARSVLIVELHESFSPGLAARLEARLEDTHEIEMVEPRKRYLEDHPAFWGSATRGLSPVQVEALLDEVRPWRTPWLIATPKAGPAPAGA